MYFEQEIRDAIRRHKDLYGDYEYRKYSKAVEFVQQVATIADKNIYVIFLNDSVEVIWNDDREYTLRRFYNSEEDVCFMSTFKNDVLHIVEQSINDLPNGLIKLRKQTGRVA